MPTSPEPPSSFLLDQYRQTGRFPINHNYLQGQFADYDEIFKELALLVERGDFTLGQPVKDFEERICGLTGARFCIGVGSGTDAIFLSLKAAGVGPGDEVITTPYTFYATVGAIATTGARPVFADIGPDLNLDPRKVAEVITERTRAVVPVHWSGLPCDMEPLWELASQHDLKIVEDACHSLCGSYRGRSTGRLGWTGCFSLHPLKNLNVWGDGGFITTDEEEARDRLSLMRNHGLLDRDTCAVWAYNSRLDSLQAVVANHLIDKKLAHITSSRQRNAHRLDELLAGVEEIHLPERPPDRVHVFHLYCFKAQRRDQLIPFLQEHGVDAKIHYPLPMHLQPAAADLGYQKGDFPQAEATCESVLSLPVHEFISDSSLELMAQKIKEFYARPVR